MPFLELCGCGKLQQPQINDSQLPSAGHEGPQQDHGWKMASKASTSYTDVTAHDSAYLHAGDVYNNVTHNSKLHPAQRTCTSNRNAFISDFASDDRSRSTSSSLSARPLAPPSSAFHQQLCIAAREGEGRTRLEYLLSKGADVDTKDAIGLTPLYYAAFRGDENNVRLLLESGAGVNPRHSLLGTPICIAALRQHTDIVRTLCQHQASVDDRTDILGSALHCAYHSGVLEIVKLILERAMEHQMTAIISLDAMSKLAKVSLPPSRIKKLPLDKWREGRDATDDWIHSQVCFTDEWHRKQRIRCAPILLAVEREHHELIDLHQKKQSQQKDPSWELIDRHALMPKPPEPTTAGRQGESSTSARFSNSRSYGSKASSFGAWSLLGFAWQGENDRCVTILMWAAASLKPKMIDRILATGADVNKKDATGKSALHYAALPFRDAEFGTIEECVERLRKAGADFNATDDYKYTPLGMVVSPRHASFEPQVSWRWGDDLHTKCVKAFLSNGDFSKSNSRETLGRALLRAVRETNGSSRCQAAIVELLCEHGAPLDYEDESGNAVLSSAIRAKAPETFISLLLNRSAPVNAAGDGQYTALQNALNVEMSEDMVETLLHHGADPNLTKVGAFFPIFIAARRDAPAAVAASLLRHGARIDAEDGWVSYTVATYLRGLLATGRLELPATIMSYVKECLADDTFAKKPNGTWVSWMLHSMRQRGALPGDEIS